MKLLSALFCLGFAVISANAAGATGTTDTTVTADVEQRRAEEIGKTYKVLKTRLNTLYKDVTVTKITDAGMTIMHSEGMVRLGYERLTPEQREAFGITKEGAAVVHAKEADNRAAYETHLAAKRMIWLEEQEDRRIDQQIAFAAHQERLIQQAAERLEMQKALLAQDAEGKTSIVAGVEVPKFPIIRGYDNQVFRPQPGYTRSYRTRHYGSNRTTIYTGGYGGSYGSYGYPVRYNSGCYSYPSRYGTYRPGYHRGTYGAINYRTGNWNIGVRW